MFIVRAGAPQISPAEEYLWIFFDTNINFFVFLRPLYFTCGGIYSDMRILLLCSKELKPFFYSNPCFSPSFQTIICTGYWQGNCTFSLNRVCTYQTLSLWIDLVPQSFSLEADYTFWSKWGYFWGGKAFLFSWLWFLLPLAAGDPSARLARIKSEVFGQNKIVFPFLNWEERSQRYHHFRQKSFTYGLGQTERQSVNLPFRCLDKGRPSYEPKVIV